MEYAAGGELYDYLSERKVLTEEEARRIFRQIASAVYYCHKVNVLTLFLIKLIFFSPFPSFLRAKVNFFSCGLFLSGCRSSLNNGELP